MDQRKLGMEMRTIPHEAIACRVKRFEVRKLGDGERSCPNGDGM